MPERPVRLGDGLVHGEGAQGAAALGRESLESGVRPFRERRLQRPPPRRIGRAVVHEVAIRRGPVRHRDERRIEPPPVRGRVGADLVSRREEARVNGVHAREGGAMSRQRAHGLPEVGEVPQSPLLRRPQPVERQRHAPGPLRQGQRHGRRDDQTVAPAPTAACECPSGAAATAPRPTAAHPSPSRPPTGPRRRPRKPPPQRHDDVSRHPPRRRLRAQHREAFRRLRIRLRGMPHRRQNRPRRRRLGRPPLPQLVAILRPDAREGAKREKIGGHGGSLLGPQGATLSPRRNSHNGSAAALTFP
jgi:hypothetical protein